MTIDEIQAALASLGLDPDLRADLERLLEVMLLAGNQQSEEGGLRAYGFRCVDAREVPEVHTSGTPAASLREHKVSPPDGPNASAGPEPDRIRPPNLPQPILSAQPQGATQAPQVEADNTPQRIAG